MKYLVYFFLAIPLLGFSQQPELQWLKEVFIRGAGGKTSLTLLDNEGGIITVSNAFNGISQFVLLKHDSTGANAWTTPLNGFYPLYEDITIDSENNPYVCYGVGKFLPQFDTEGKLAKYNKSTGAKDWEISYDETYFCADRFIKACAVDSLGRILVLGSNYDFDVFQDSCYNMFLFCHDAETGAELWRQVWTGLHQTQDLKVLDDQTIALHTYRYDSVSWKSVIQHLDYDGNVISEGTNNGRESVGANYITNSGELVYGVKDYRNGYAATKIGISGDTLWHYSAPNPGNWDAYSTGIADDEFGNIYITGTMSPDTVKDFERVTTKLSPDGDVLWQQYFELDKDSAFIDDGYFLSVDSTTVLTVGYSYLIDSFYLVIIGYDRETGDELFVATVVDIPTGDEVWHYKDGFVFTSTVWRAGEAYLNIGRFRVPKITSSQVPIPKSKFDISVYPNPTSTYINACEIDEKRFSQVQIINPSGNVMHQQKLEGSEFSYDFSAHPSGVYILRFVGEKANFSKKIMVQEP